MPDSSPRAYFLVGPTAAGKTAVAQRLAEQRGADILSADSMLVYRGMDIGTAKPSADDRRRVRYWGVDVIEPSESYNVASFLEEARQCFAASAARGIPVIVAGGTGLYVKALLEGLESMPASSPERRRHWQGVLDREGVAGLQSALRRLNAAWLESLPDRNNGRRLIRALEQVEAGAELPLRTWHRGGSCAPITGLDLDRGLLGERIEDRVRAMYDGGLLQEVGSLLAGCWNPDGTAAQAIGYAEAIACIKGEVTREVAMGRTAARTRQLAKRQMTWFRHQANVKWIQVQRGMSLGEIAGIVSAEWDASGPLPVVLGGLSG